MTASRSFFTRFAPALALMIFSLGWTVGLTVWPRSGQPLAAIFPPSAAGSPALLAVAAAGADEVLTFGGWASVVLVRSNGPDLISRLYDAGALLVLRAPQMTDCL